MVTNNAILWEINEIVGNLRPELSTHIRLIMLRAGLSRRWSRFLLNFCCRLSEMLADGNNTSKVQKGWRRSSQIQCDQEISWFKSLLRHLIRIPQRYRKFKSYYFFASYKTMETQSWSIARGDTIIFNINFSNKNFFVTHWVCGR